MNDDIAAGHSNDMLHFHQRNYLKHFAFALHSSLAPAVRKGWFQSVWLAPIATNRKLLALSNLSSTHFSHRTLFFKVLNWSRSLPWKRSLVFWLIKINWSSWDPGIDIEMFTLREVGECSAHWASLHWPDSDESSRRRSLLLKFSIAFELILKLRFTCQRVSQSYYS